VIDVQSNDPDGDTEGAGLTYSITDGADQSKFSIVAATGVLSFIAAPDFENPLDLGGIAGDNIYEVQVTVTDSGGLTDVQDIAVTVNDVQSETVEGSDGDDTIFGGIGSDTLTGGPGDDVLDGGVSADSYIYTPGDGNDIINDRYLFL